VAATSTHATITAMHFPPNSGLIFLTDEMTNAEYLVDTEPTDEMTNDKYLVDTEATLSIVPHIAISKPFGPLLRGANGLPIPCWGFIMKAIQFQAKFCLPVFCKLQWQIHSGY
jgi:hypothetical protein